MGYGNFCAGIAEYLAATAMVPMIVTVEQITDWLVGDSINRFEQAFGVLAVYRFNSNDTVGSHDKH